MRRFTVPFSLPLLTTLLITSTSIAAAQSLLFGLDGFDPLVVATSVGLLATIAMAAALAPAMRAARIDPMRALRWD